ncbi:B12-binding domain-containing radical SAM protein [Methanofollis ethanolicus]|uniref:B12-binding domain-containing radical SAM protein n=1 Tax=Methanofollis ethanolicus TaxID=488124 RepID=UPI00082C799E|nr:radical SAM protein [Methanofollis ethanolicus]
MKIYLLNPPYFPHFGRSARWQDTGRAGTLYYPIWLSYATALLEQEHETRLVDAPAWNWKIEDVIDDIGKFDPDILVIDSSFPSLNNDISVAEAVKDSYPAITTVLVGPPASQYAAQILKHAAIDIVVRWEYDFTLRELARVLEDAGDLSSVKGISYRVNGQVVHNPDREFSTSADLDTIPFVSKVYKKYLHIEDYFLGQSLYPEVQIFTGRGCPNQCTFCAWPQTLTGRKYRVRSIASVLDELAWIEANLKVKEVFFEDDTFTISKERVMEFCKGYQERGLSVTWSCNARANTLDLETMQAMKKANCRLLIAGYESGVDSILQAIKKGITTDQIRTFAENARKAGLLVHGDFIIGLPGETKETIEQTKKLIREVRPDILQVAVASPFPGTEFYVWCKGNGYLLTDDPNEYLDDEGHQKAILSYPALSNEEMVREANEILRGYYLSPGYVPLAMRQVCRKNAVAEVKRLWFSTKMFLGYVSK